MNENARFQMKIIVYSQIDLLIALWYKTFFFKLGQKFISIFILDKYLFGILRWEILWFFTEHRAPVNFSDYELFHSKNKSITFYSLQGNAFSLQYVYTKEKYSKHYTFNYTDNEAQ